MLPHLAFERRLPLAANRRRATAVVLAAVAAMVVSTAARGPRRRRPLYVAAGGGPGECAAPFYPTVASAVGAAASVRIRIAATAGLGPRTRVLTNPDGGTSSYPAYLTVDAPPTVSSVRPAVVDPGAVDVPVTVTGTGFQSGVTVGFSGGVTTTVTSVAASGTSLVLAVTVPTGTPAGPIAMQVQNPDGGTARLIHALRVS